LQRRQYFLATSAIHTADNLAVELVARAGPWAISTMAATVGALQVFSSSGVGTWVALRVGTKSGRLADI